jgi:hypothetical protein
LSISLFLSIKRQTQYSDHHDAKKKGMNKTSIAVGTIQYKSLSIGRSQAACHVTERTLPIGVDIP